MSAFTEMDDDNTFGQPFGVAQLIRRQAHRLDEGLLDDFDDGLIADAELLAGLDAPAVALEADVLQRSLRRIADGHPETERLRLRVIACRARLRAFVSRRRLGEAVSMADIWRSEGRA
jgi:hypothetical protein